MDEQGPGKRRTLRPWTMVWAATVVFVVAAIGLRAAFTRMYVSHAEAERAKFGSAYGDDGDAETFAYEVSGCRTLADVRSATSRFGPLRPADGDRPGSRFTCDVPPTGRRFGWHATFDFDAGRLIDTHVLPIDNPIVVRWDGWAVWADRLRLAADGTLLAVAAGLLLTVAFAWRFRRELGRVATAAAIGACVLSALSEQPTRTFRPARAWRAVAVPAAALLPAAVLAAWPGRRRVPKGACHHCGYDLTGNVSGVCPECGTPRRRPPAPIDTAAADALDRMTSDQS